MACVLRSCAATVMTFWACAAVEQGSASNGAEPVPGLQADGGTRTERVEACLQGIHPGGLTMVAVYIASRRSRQMANSPSWWHLTWIQLS